MSERLMMSEEECRKKVKELLQIPKEDLLTKYMFQEQENERLKNGYCELKEKCNNGECDCTNEEYDGMLESNIKLSLEVDRLNNIINELEKWLKMIPKHFMDKRSLNNGVYIEQGMQKQIDLTLDKLKELKESVK